jgi:hypothetical protein
MRSQYVDLSKFPDNEKTHLLELAIAHNALCEDVDRISGATPEEKIEMHAVFAKLRLLIHQLHAKRFSISLFTLEIGFIMFILEKLGLNTRSLIPDLIQWVEILK